MALNFPPSPTIGDTYTSEIGVTYRWNGFGWSTTVTATDQAFSNIDSDIDKLEKSISASNSNNDSDKSSLIKRIVFLENKREDSEQLDYKLDSEYRARKDADSDISNATNSGLTLERHDRIGGDSDLNTRLTFLENKREDSEYINTLLDSEYRARKDADNAINARLDSDELKLQYHSQRLDSDEVLLAHISTRYVRTVNGIQSDINNNVPISLTSVKTGTEDQRGATTPVNGAVWVVSGDSDALNDGRAYIYDSEISSWNRISGLDTAQGDARYVNIAGDTMLGSFALAGDPTLAAQAANKHYVDAGDSDLTVRINKEIHDRAAGDSDLFFNILDAGTGIDSDF